MAKSTKPVLRQRIFEARYPKGYRYLDRCGELLLNLEELLPTITGTQWMPRQVAPTAAHIQSPELDVKVVINSYHMVLDHNPVGEACFDFGELCGATLASVVARFDLREMGRFGYRRIKILPEQDLNSAQMRSAALSPHGDWWNTKPEPYSLHQQTIESYFELPDRSKGIRIRTEPFAKLGVDLEIDEHLKLAPHLLPERQRDALVEQLRRQKMQRNDPESGVAIDIDYFWLRPPTDYSVPDFISAGEKEADALESAYLQGPQK